MRRFKVKRDYLLYLLSHERDVSNYAIDRELAMLVTLPEVPAWSNMEVGRLAGGEEAISNLKAEEPLKLESKLKRQPIAIEQSIYGAGLEAIEIWADRII